MPRLARAWPALLVVLGFCGPARPDATAGWPALPEGTRAVVLVTGADYGFYFPKGCNGRAGGAVYRANFDAWLAGQSPDVQRVWISTGDNGPGETEGTISLDELYGYFGRVGYALSGVGETELRLLGGAQLAGLSRTAGMPLISTNLVVHETGRTLFPGSSILDIAGARVLFVGVSPHDPRGAWGAPDLGTIVTIPPASAMIAEIQRHRGAVDAVVLVAALNRWDLEGLLREVSGIDIVVAPRFGGHSGPDRVGGVPALWVGPEGQALGRVALGERGRILEAREVLVQDEFPVDPMTGERLAHTDHRTLSTPQ